MKKDRVLHTGKLETSGTVLVNHLQTVFLDLLAHASIVAGKNWAVPGTVWGVGSYLFLF